MRVCDNIIYMDNDEPVNWKLISKISEFEKQKSLPVINDSAFFVGLTYTRNLRKRNREVEK